MTRTVTEKRIDDLIASGVTLRFTGRVFEQKHTPGKGETFSLADVMRRVAPAALGSPPSSLTASFTSWL